MLKCGLKVLLHYILLLESPILPIIIIKTLQPNLPIASLRHVFPYSATIQLAFSNLYQSFRHHLSLTLDNLLH